MTIVYKKSGNLLLEQVDAIVNTVNCEGYMGKGLAEQFVRHFGTRRGDYFKDYVAACKDGRLRPGRVLVYPVGLGFPMYIINFPSKDRWRANSRMEYVEDGLRDLREKIVQLKISSIALPPVGCGNGKLKWSEIKPLIERYLDDLDDVKVIVYEPRPYLGPGEELPDE